MLQVAMEMLFGDRLKYWLLISAIAFSTMLMIQQSSIFWAVMRTATTILRNTNVPIWVVDPHVEEANVVKNMRNIEYEKVRSVPGIEWALPMIEQQLPAMLYNGDFKLVELFGVDNATLLGVPPELIKGQLQDLWQADAVIVDQVGIRKLSASLKKPLDVGDVFSINDHEVKIVGIVKAESSFFAYPIIYTTYDRALEIGPKVRRNLSYILVKPKPNVDINQLAKDIEKRTGLKAFTSDAFFWSTIKWFFVNTGIPTSFGLTVFLGFIIGLAVSAQTFYSFINENFGNLAALKAMGANQALLKRMVYVQAAIVGLIGYGIGLLLTVVFGFAVTSLDVVLFLTWQIALTVFVLICLICFFTATLGVRRISKLQADEVFRE